MPQSPKNGPVAPLPLSSASATRVETGTANSSVIAVEIVENDEEVNSDPGSRNGSHQNLVIPIQYTNETRKPVSNIVNDTYLLNARVRIT